MFGDRSTQCVFLNNRLFNKLQKAGFDFSKLAFLFVLCIACRLKIQYNSGMNIAEKYEKALSKQEKQALSLCSQLADDIDVKIYIVGGIVRDILLNRPFNDIDILLEYDAVLFADLLHNANRENVKILAKNEQFKTVKLGFNIAGKVFEADMASTRSEIYEYPSAYYKFVGCFLK